MLQYALDLQLLVNSSWEEEMRQPRWQPWRGLTPLFSDETAIPDAQRALLLQFVLASPSPSEVRSQTCFHSRFSFTLAVSNPQGFTRAHVRCKSTGGTLAVCQVCKERQ